MIKTKIICTLGPAVDDPAVMEKLILNGIDVARMNFSHGSHEEHLARLLQFRSLCGIHGISLPVLLDTKGPEIRLGDIDGKVEIKEGQAYIFTTGDVVGDAKKASVSYKELAHEVYPGDKILIDDGLVIFEVERVSGEDIHCVALNDGVFSSKKSINVPGKSLNLPALTKRDKSDLLFAIENEYDFIAVSFVRKREDVAEILHFLEENGGKDIKVISKIESSEGIANLDEIIRVSDGIMIARGDLGVEIPVEEIPAVQKDMIKRCYSAEKPVITATQMLDSMIRNPRPTRAEVTDVANAIYDGTSAIMLSGETASGRYPIEALQTMKRIAETTEKSIKYWKRLSAHDLDRSNRGIASAISHATCTTAMDLNAACIVAVTKSGSTARQVSGFRPACPIIATTTDKKASVQLRLNWGVLPVLVDVVGSTDDLFNVAVDAARKSGLASDGDLIVITSGVPVGVSGTTNMIKVQMIGNVLCRGKGIGTKSETGSVCVITGKSGANEYESFARGHIIVTEEITDDILPTIRQARAVVLDGEDKEGKAETLAKALEIPIIVEAFGAMDLLKSGTVINVDAEHGIVQCVD